MRIFQTIIGAISASRLTMDGIYPVYPMDLLRDHGHMKHHIGQPKLKTNNPMFNQLVEENQLWKSKIKFSNRKGFINGLINTPATLAINSDTLQIIDHSEFCWVIGSLTKYFSSISIVSTCREHLTCQPIDSCLQIRKCFNKSDEKSNQYNGTSVL